MYFRSVLELVKETETSWVELGLDELEVSSTFSTTVALLVDIVLVYSSSSDVSPSLGEMIESAIFVHVFVLGTKNEYPYICGSKKQAQKVQI